MVTKLRLCLPVGHSPYQNLALEEYLMRSCESGECILSLWRNENTVVIGRNQNARQECRVDALEADGGRLARRLSGGGAVFHDLGNLNFSFLARDPDYNVDRQLSVIQAALRRFGLNAEKTGRNDLTVDGRKFSGNAFLREGQARCHHGTLLISVSGAALGKYLTPDPAKLAAKGVKSVPARVVNLADLCPALTVDSIVPALREAFGEVYGLPVEDLPLDALDWAAIGAGEARLADPAWIFGRDPSFNRHSSRQRFAWGSAELALSVEEGTIREAMLFTDAMDETLSARVADSLAGVPLTEAAARLSALPDTEAAGDLARLLSEVV